MSLFLGVAGGSGSGKTTVADEIVRRIGADRLVHLHQDRYYRDLGHLSRDERARCNFDHPDAIEDDLMVAHLDLLAHGESAPLPVYDFTRHVRTSSIDWTQPRPVILVEGILILAVAAIRERLDVKLYVDTAADIRLIRRIRRDTTERGRTVDSVIEQWSSTVRTMHRDFVEPSKRFADLVIPEGGFNTVALDVVISRIERALEA